MYIRKKNNENSRIKRPAKRSKSCDMFFTSGYGFYLKPIVIFSVLLTIDFLMEIRVEYLWSCWLILKSMTDSYKYQGLLFSLFFILIVLTSDIICYLLIPITWLFFLASCYVWIQLVGYTERGICLPTVIICLFFFYIEYILRLRGFSHVSLSMEICRPFAANSIGYPVVTMGFGLKSYVTYKFRMRKQRDVEAENRFFFQLLDQALPEGNKRYKVTVDGEHDTTSSLCDDSAENSSVDTTPSPPCTTSLPSLLNTKPIKSTISNGKVDNNGHSSDLVISKSQPNSLDYVDLWALSTQHKSPLSNGHLKQQKTVTNGSCITEVSTVAVQNPKKGTSSCHHKHHNKDDITRFDMELKKLKSDLQTGKITEVDLRAQLSQANHIYNSVKLELNQCRQELLAIQNKFQSLQQKYQNEKHNNSLIEKKLNEEKKNSQLIEQQLVTEKKARKDESEIKSKALQSVTLAAAKSSECTESCKSKRRQLDIELKTLRKEKQNRDEQIRSLEQQLLELPKLRKMVEEYQHMSMNIINLREEKEHLVRTLSDENKIKQNLITAYHSSLKEVNALNEQLTQKDYQILQLNMNGVPDYMNNHHHQQQQQQQQMSHYQQQMNRHTPMSPSSSPLMDESNFYSSSNSTSLMSPSMYNSAIGQSSSNNSNDYNNIAAVSSSSQTSSSTIGNVPFSSLTSSSPSLSMGQSPPSSSGFIIGSNGGGGVYHCNSGINSQSRINDKMIGGGDHQSTASTNNNNNNNNNNNQW